MDTKKIKDTKEAYKFKDVSILEKINIPWDIH